MIRDGQVKELRRRLSQCKSLVFSARIAGITDRTARNYRNDGHLKDRIDQALMLRGSCEFAARDEYVRFVEQIIVRVDRRISADDIEVSHQGHIIQTMPRLVGKKLTAIKYRYITDSLVRKTGYLPIIGTAKKSFRPVSFVWPTTSSVELTQRRPPTKCTSRFWIWRFAKA